nr:F-box/LRR-repeat protein 25-like [Tanacetum cinerariifolium]
MFFNTSCITRMILSFCRFNPPNGAISWERLKCLCLCCVTLDEDMIEKILSGSPCLEFLELKICFGYRWIDVTSKSVKKLVFSRYNSYSKLVLGELVFLDVSSLIKAVLYYYMDRELDYSIDGRKSGIFDELVFRGLLESFALIASLLFESCFKKLTESLGLSVRCKDNGSFIDEIIFDLNRAPDSPNQFHCFHCKDVLKDGETCKRCTCAKCGSGLDKGLCYICGHNHNSLNDSPRISETSSQSPLNINHCCYECGDPLDGIFSKRCTCKSCGKDAHTGYNCPSKVPVISIPKPCNNQTIDELPQPLPIFHPTFHSEAESPFTLDSTPTYVDESPNVFIPPPQPLMYSCEFCWSNAQYGHYCTPQAPFINPKPGYSQDFNFPQDIHNFQQ